MNDQRMTTIRYQQLLGVIWMCESWWFVGNRSTIGEGHVARIAASELRRLMVVGAKARLIELKSKIAYLIFSGGLPRTCRSGSVRNFVCEAVITPSVE